MGVYETFSKRKKKQERAGQSDVYQYTDLPRPFRVQVTYIWKDAIGPYNFCYTITGYERDPSPSNSLWDSMHNTLAREIGTFNLTSTLSNKNSYEKCQYYLVEADTDGALDIIEITFRMIDDFIRNKMSNIMLKRASIKQNPDDAIDELNHRFKEHGIGYQFVGGNIIRIDSQYIHEEAVKPAISLLHEVGFSGVSDEFFSAHTHYRKGEVKDAIADALKAFESTMKAICDERSWGYPENATAKPLLDIIFGNDLVPSELQSHFTGVRATLESGLPTVRNKTAGAGHGQGKDKIEIPDYLAAYALNLAASNIVLLIEAHKSKR